MKTPFIKSQSVDRLTVLHVNIVVEVSINIFYFYSSCDEYKHQNARMPFMIFLAFKCMRVVRTS